MHGLGVNHTWPSPQQSLTVVSGTDQAPSSGQLPTIIISCRARGCKRSGYGRTTITFGPGLLQAPM